jgi:hypothetical protein
MKLMKKIILIGLSSILSTTAFANHDEAQEQEAIRERIEILKEKTLSDVDLNKDGGPKWTDTCECVNAK